MATEQAVQREMPGEYVAITNNMEALFMGSYNCQASLYISFLSEFSYVADLIVKTTILILAHQKHQYYYGHDHIRSRGKIVLQYSIHMDKVVRVKRECKEGKDYF